MKLLNKISLGLATFLMIIFFVEKSFIILDVIEPSVYTKWFEYLSFMTFIPFFYFIVKEYMCKQNEIFAMMKYSKKLNQVLISQSHNPLFYQGNIKEGGKTLTKEVTTTIDTDRCSIWLYNEKKNSITCELLYVKSKDSYTSGLELLEEDFKCYFEHLRVDPIIIADDAETHPATSCFTEDYLRPIGIKSMLDVPIIFKGQVIGVICIESKTPRKWSLVEVNFAQLLSSLYSFAYSTKEINKLGNDLLEFDRFVDVSALVSKTDYKGRITYVNKRFEEVSGYKKEELIGKDHKIVNSGEHPVEFWKEMYKKVIYEKGIWNAIVTNKNKNGELYWVDSFIKADFDENGRIEGFMSIRYDITDVIKKNIEIENKNTYLEHAAKIIRHDMHSGINTYIPRGISALERRLTDDDIENLKIQSPLKMIKEGLKHTQKVYKGVYEFTNLVKKNTSLNKEKYNIKTILENYLDSTSYKGQVIIDEIGEFKINEPLFCTAVDNLIRNGLKYNDSETKFVKIYKEKVYVDKKIQGTYLIIQDNGRGLTQSDLNRLSKPYTRKRGQKEKGTGLGLNICIAILKEHGFDLTCEKNEIGTKMKIKLR